VQTGAYANATQLAEDIEGAFQIIALTLDADDNVIERKVIPYPYQTREGAVDSIESVVTRFC
jgi:hypothetical protein